MIQIYDEYVGKYIPREHTGKPALGLGTISALLNTEQHQAYRNRVRQIREYLSGFDVPWQLGDVLTNLYDLSFDDATDFLFGNANKRWREADTIEKQCIVIHNDRRAEMLTPDFRRAMDALKGK